MQAGFDFSFLRHLVCPSGIVHAAISRPTSLVQSSEGLLSDMATPSATTVMINSDVDIGYLAPTPDQVGTLSFEMFMQTRVENLTRGAPTKPDGVADAFNCAISKRLDRLLTEYKITADQYRLFPYEVRYHARYYLAKTWGDVKADASTTLAQVVKTSDTQQAPLVQAKMIGVKNLIAPVNVLRKHIASYVHKIGLVATRLSSENFEEWMKIQVITGGRTNVLIGLAPIKDIVAYLSKCMDGKDTSSASASAESKVPRADAVQTRSKRKAKTAPVTASPPVTAPTTSKRKVKKLKTATLSLGD